MRGIKKVNKVKRFEGYPSYRAFVHENDNIDVIDTYTLQGRIVLTFKEGGMKMDKQKKFYHYKGFWISMTILSLVTGTLTYILQQL